MGEQTSSGKGEEQGGEPETGEMTVSSSADEAKQREREMEESGEENAA